MNATVWAQPRQYFPTTPPATSPTVPMVPIQPGYGAPATYGPPVSAPVLGTPQFDPYATPNTGIFGNPFGSSGTGSVFGGATQPPAFGQPVLPPPPVGGSPYGSSVPAFPNYPGTTPNPYPAQNPSSLYPNGIPWSPYDPNAQPFAPLSLFDGLRISDTWIMGGKGGNVSINDTEVATSMQIPNFLGTQQTLRVTPGFAMHLWQGPASVAPDFTNLPPRAYSAYLEGNLRSDPAQTFGGDLTASVGVYSDFNTLTSHSLRIQGLGYGWVRLTPQFMFKIGANYLDRVEIKILPAIGFLWEPNPQTKLDIFFPKPKLSRYVTTLGNTDFWAYIGGEYGGGSWTIEHPNGQSDQVDINDIRIVLGTDWTSQSGLKGMAEVGYVTHRQLRYRESGNENITLPDSVMLRAGLMW